jgi:predicted nucleic acid-binding protein
VIAACIAAEADLLISGDRQLLTIGQHQGTRVVTPAEALRLITGS